MKYAIITTEKNEASKNIKKALERYDLKDSEIYTFSDHTYNLEDLDMDVDAFIFPTKHESESKKKTLTVHITGNFNDNKFGGKKRTLSLGSGLLLKKAFLLLNKYNDLDYEVSLEATHHGPDLNKPHFFIEIGSSEEEWKDEKAAEVIARVIKDVVNSDVKEEKVCIGLGSGHYCSNFNKILLNSDIAISHICPKHNLPFFNKRMLKEALEKTSEKVDFILLDWKGMGKEKARIITLLEDENIEYKKTKDI